MNNYSDQVERDRQQLIQEQQKAIAEVERDRQQLQKQQQQEQEQVLAKVERDRQALIQQQQQVLAKIEDDRQKLRQQQQKIFLPVSYIHSPALSEGLLIDIEKDISGVGFIVGGALAGVSTSAMIGGMGLVGKFGGIGLGLGTMTGTGILIGAATYEALTAIIEEDTIALAAVGGIIGLGVYGLTKIVSDGTRDSKIYRNLEFLETITREYEEERKWAELESGYLGIDAELQA